MEQSEGLRSKLIDDQIYGNDLMCIRLTLIFIVAILLSSCAEYSHTDSRRPVKLHDDSFPQPEPDFSQYRTRVMAYLSAYSLPDRTEAGIRLNLPFELKADKDVPYRGKFLLFHGLNDSAYVWADMAAELALRGFDVRAILLPGHGSHPVEMLDISYRDWLSAARAHFKLWNTDSTPIYLGGFSMGAVITTILALENNSISGLLLISPAYHSRLNSLLRWSWLYAWYKPWMFGGLILEDNPTKYNSIPINSGTQYYRMTQYLKNLWQQNELEMPILMVTSTNDSVVDVKYTRKLFQQRFGSDRKKLLLYTDDETLVTAQNEVSRTSAYPDLRILNQSHLSLINSPANRLLGKNGTQLICNGNEYPIFIACMRATEHWYGAQYTASPDGVAVARTTYNPDFDTVLKQFDSVFMD